jgi:hypothetical protein
MSGATTTLGQLMERNVSEVFSERDPGRNRHAIAELYAEDCASYDENGESVGQAAISDRVGRILDESPPGFTFSPGRLGTGDPRPRPPALEERPRGRSSGPQRHGRRGLRQRKDPGALHIHRDAGRGRAMTL